MAETDTKTIGGRYRIIKLIGEGGMAEVYLAEDLRLKRTVAIKFIHRRKFGTEQFGGILKRFTREAETMARLSHPNIVNIHDFGKHGGEPYLVMEYIPGGSLKQRLARGLVPWQEAVNLLLPVADALAYAHGEGVVHRDVKPANILFNRRGEPVLSDFGVARLLDTEETSTQLTSTGFGLGTPHYVAPEQWLGNPGPASDQYSLGVVLYELVTGHKPYTADTSAAILLKQANEPLPRPSSFIRDLPEGVEDFLYKALAKNPEGRFRDMNAFKTALEKLPALPSSIPAVKPQPAASHSPPTGRPPNHPELMPLNPDRNTGRPLPQTAPAGMKLLPWLPWVIGAVFALFTLSALTIGLVVPALVQANIKATEQASTAATQAIASSSTAAAQSTLAEKTSQANVIIKKIAATARAFNTTSTSAAQSVYFDGTRQALAVLQVKSATAAAWTPPPLWTSTPASGIREKDGMAMVYVPAGPFQMGSGDGDSNEQPVHTVSLDAFWIDRTEITNAMYAKCVADGDCTDPSSKSSSTRGSYYGDSQFADYPVIYVDWFQASAYCQWAGARLPSEAEWEKAARGDDGRKYPWGSQEPDANLGYFNQNVGDTTETGSYPDGASPYGAVDMAGNVWEWTGSLYKSYPYDPNDGREDLNSLGTRVLRGGSWYRSTYDLRSANRSRNDPEGTLYLIGFRCLFPD